MYLFWFSFFGFVLLLILLCAFTECSVYLRDFLDCFVDFLFWWFSLRVFVFECLFTYTFYVGFVVAWSVVVAWFWVWQFILFWVCVWMFALRLLYVLCAWVVICFIAFVLVYCAYVINSRDLLLCYVYLYY